ncbi:hypothetical protein ElyMa_004989400 [Elysia marginata]|uniref:Uncharacterized protein n=1 Tax=Elysia marginata TaxID=1093978 RepID=A0AAV4J9Q9_9GAST|nr:hypothetical protein ElyMa_004989400 [Elysia marginata]
MRVRAGSHQPAFNDKRTSLSVPDHQHPMLLQVQRSTPAADHQHPMLLQVQVLLLPINFNSIETTVRKTAKIGGERWQEPVLKLLLLATSARKADDADYSCLICALFKVLMCVMK